MADCGCSVVVTIDFGGVVVCCVPECGVIVGDAGPVDGAVIGVLVCET